MSDHESSQVESVQARWPRSLAERLAAALVGFVLLATAVVVAIEYGRGRATLVAEAKSRLETQNRLAVDRIERALRDRIRLVEAWPELDASQDLAIDDLDKRLASSLVQLASSFGGQDVAVGVDPAGSIVAASRRDWIGRDTRGSAWFSAIGAADSGAALRVVRDSSVTQLVAFSRVTADAGHRFLGWIVVLTPWRSILDDADAGGALLAVRDDAGGIVSRDRGLVAADTATYLWTRRQTATIGGVRLGVASAVPTSAVLAPLRRTGRQLVSLAAVVLLVTLPGAILLVRSTTGALRRLTDAALGVQHEARPSFAAVPATAPREVRVLASALQTMVDRLDASRRELVQQERLAAMGAMAAALAHEIRTPLSIIRGAAEMLERGGADEARADELVSFVTDEVERLSRLVDDMLRFARPRAPVAEPTDLAAIAGRAAQALEPRMAEAGLRFEASLAAAPLDADAGQLYQVVLNLLTNAISASPPDSALRLATRPASGRAVLEVCDEGAGIPTDAQEKIWLPFYTTRAAGTGLGLPIVRRIVEEHGGTISIDSRPGRGTRIIAEFPPKPTRS